MQLKTSNLKKEALNNMNNKRFLLKKFQIQPTLRNTLKAVMRNVAKS
jgi:hypothetical protein